MKKHTTVLTYMKNENLQVVYKQESRTYLAVDEMGEVKQKGFKSAKDAIDFAFDYFKKGN